MSTMNGHARDEAPTAPVMVPLALPVQRLGGEVSPWPLNPAGKPPQRRHVMAVTSAVLAHRGWLAAIPVILVNAVAFAGQLAFLRGHLPWPLPGQVLVAVTLESVAVYLAWQAHLALAADDSALRLRMAAYGFAAVIGIMNYSHYMAAHWRPTFAAVTFGLMSVSSPWLWSVHSRRASRDALKARGLIEPHAVRLGATRWTWHPLRSAKVMFRATWAGENDPADAIALPAITASGDGQVTSAGLAEIAAAAVPSQVDGPVPSHPEIAAVLLAQAIPAPLTEVRPPVPAEVSPAEVTSHSASAPQVKSRRKPAVRPARISDADLKQEIRVLFAADAKVSINAAADQLGRSRDRVRPLLEQVRAETGA
jgi:hypothetical protein